MMSGPKELSFDEILKYMLEHNGRVTNRELVKHFKVFLMNPDMRDEARTTFKKHVNSLTLIKNQNNEKWLILRKKYMPNSGKENEEESKPLELTAVNTAETVSHQDTNIPTHPLPVQLNQDFNVLSSIIQDTVTLRNKGEVRESSSKDIFASPLKDSLVSPLKDSLLSPANDSIEYPSEDIPPKVYPRRKSSDKTGSEKKPSVNQGGQLSSILNQENVSEAPILTSCRSESMLVDNEQKISVKERKQMFNKMASESDVLKVNKMSTYNMQGVEEEDRVSLDQKSEVDPLDLKQKQWIMCAARGEYHALAKMCKENAKLAKTKDSFTTAMHWACKRGDENLVKLLAGVTRQLVNERSGYTPLHIAKQFRHENVYTLLVDTYDADPNIRDWSGRKPKQYSGHMDTCLSPGSYRKADNIDNQRPDTAPPDIRISPITMNNVTKKESFLRIGSLNVRVKRTTEAFSNFLGVGTPRSSAYVGKSGKDREDRRSDDGELHKTWGSADNIQNDDKLMPPPMSSKVRRRAASGRRGVASHSRSTPSTPDQPRAQIGTSEDGDSDSDSAAGFHAAWRQQRASNCT